jgi:hypothetical protein
MRWLPALALLCKAAWGDEGFAFFDACADGDTEPVRSALAAGLIDVNYPDENGATPLFIGARAELACSLVLAPS